MERYRIVRRDRGEKERERRTEGESGNMEEFENRKLLSGEEK